MRSWQQPLRAGSSDRYSVTVDNWLDGDTITSAVWTGDGVAASSLINQGAVCSALLSVAAASTCPIAVTVTISTSSGRSLALTYGLVVVDSLTP